MLFSVIQTFENVWIGGDEEDRTPDPLLARQVLSQLSYTPKFSLILCQGFLGIHMYSLRRLSASRQKLLCLNFVSSFGCFVDFHRLWTCNDRRVPVYTREWKFARCGNLVGLSGLEPPTSRLSGVRSNRLSYRPMRVDIVGLFPQVLLFILLFNVLLCTLENEQRVYSSYRPFKSKWCLASLLRLNWFCVKVGISSTAPCTSVHKPEKNFEIDQNFSLERRWSSRTFRYGYLVTTSPQSSTPPSTAAPLRLAHRLRVLSTLMVWRAVCTRPGNVFTAVCWPAITSNSNFIQASCSLQSELGSLFEICSTSRYCSSL